MKTRFENNQKYHWIKCFCYFPLFNLALLCGCEKQSLSHVNLYQLNTGTIFVSPDGDDHNEGTINSPIASFARAQDLASPGDTVYFRGGIYKINAYTDVQQSLYACIVDLTKSGSKGKPICYFGYPGE